MGSGRYSDGFKQRHLDLTCCGGSLWPLGGEEAVRGAGVDVVGQFCWLGQGGSFELNFRHNFQVQLIEFAKGLDTGSKKKSQE